MLVDVVENLIVREELVCSGSIDFYKEFNTIGVVRFHVPVSRDDPFDFGSMTLVRVWVRFHKECASNEIIGCKSRHLYVSIGQFLVIYSITSVTNDGLRTFLPFVRCNTSVCVNGIGAWADVRAMDDAFGFGIQDFVGQGVTNVLGDANPVAKAFAAFLRETSLRVIGGVVHRFIEREIEEYTDIWCYSREGF